MGQHSSSAEEPYGDKHAPNLSTGTEERGTNKTRMTKPKQQERDRTVNQKVGTVCTNGNFRIIGKDVQNYNFADLFSCHLNYLCNPTPKINKQQSPTKFDSMLNILECEVSLKHTRKDQKMNLVSKTDRKR